MSTLVVPPADGTNAVLPFTPTGQAGAFCVLSGASSRHSYVSKQAFTGHGISSVSRLSPVMKLYASRTILTATSRSSSDSGV